MTHTLTRPDTTQLAESGRALETATPLEILQWAVDQFGSRLTFATGFGAEGCVVVDLIGRHRLPVDIFTLDTGLLFPETYDLWRRLEARYALTIRGVCPELTVDEQAAAHGPLLWTRHADRCCEMRKVSPLVTELSRFDRVDHRDPTGPDGKPRQRARGRVGSEVRSWQGEPAGGLDQEGGLVSSAPERRAL